ncbi:MAG: hypothetical protein JW720_02215 [Sedimentisphaerales bacterium]|nr:hypothetical protein [Sedimentisphaerales bacterium]
MQAGEKTKTPKNAGRRIAKWIVVLLVVLVVLVVLAVPAIVSSGGFGRYLLSKINSSISGRADFADLSMGWLKGVRVRDLTFQDASAGLSVKVKNIATKPHYSSLLVGDLAFGTTTIDQPRVEIEVKQPSEGSAAVDSGGQAAGVGAAGIAIVTDVVINDGSIRVTDARSQTTELSKINSKIGLRLPPKQSTLVLDTVLVAKGAESNIHAEAKVAPKKQKGNSGWTLEGATGDVQVQISELDLESLEPFLTLVGAEVQAKGRISADLKGELKNGRMANVLGKVTGRNLNIAAPQLKGDSFATSVLDADVKVTRQDDMISIESMKVRTDWANLDAVGTVPTTLTSLDDLLAPESASDLKGAFNCDLAAVASQMPRTLGLKEGTRIVTGSVAGSVQTVAQAGKKQLKANIEIVDLKGIVDGKEASLSSPVRAEMLASKDKAGLAFDHVSLAASFANIRCAGSAEKINYNADVDLEKFQSEFGRFVDLGGYKLAGRATETGEIAISDEKITVAGAAQINALKITSPNDVTVTEPKADISFAVGYDRKDSIVTVQSIRTDATFGRISVTDAVVPLGDNKDKAMDAAVTASNVDLAKLRPFAVIFASFPEKMQLSGIAESQVEITFEKDTYKIVTDKTSIKDFQVTSPGKKPFTQRQVSLAADVELNSARKTYTVKKLDLSSDQIKASFAPAKLTTEGEVSTVVGKASLDYDSQALGLIASDFLPSELKLEGRRTTSVEFAGRYPAGDSGKLLSNMSTSKCTVGFDKAQYRGFNLGRADINAQFEKGLLRIDPFTTTANNGQITLSANADFTGPSPVIRTDQPISVTNLQINETLSHEFKGLLAKFNPVFKDALGVGGSLNFKAEELFVPLDPARTDDIGISGSLSMEQVNFIPTGLLGKLLSPMGLGGRQSVANVHSTRFTVAKGRVQYVDTMQMDLLDKISLFFKGSVGLDEVLNMQVGVPISGQTRWIPLGGTVDKPEVNLGGALQNEIRNTLLDLLGDALKK